MNTPSENELPNGWIVGRLATLIWNLRFNLGYRIGKFTHAKRDY